MTARQYGIEVGDTRSPVADDDFENVRRRIVPNSELGSAAAGIFEGVSRKLGNGSGDACLILSLEAQELGKPARPLADEHDVGLALERHKQ
jgi:hypothetical protein